MRALERYLLLQIIDQRWREHLYDMDYLREGIHLRGFAQIEPLVAYKNEAFTLFQDLMNTIWSDFARMIYNVEVEIEGENGDGAAAAPAGARRRLGGRSSSTPAARWTTSRARTARAPTTRSGRGAAGAGPAAPRRRERAARPQRPVLVRVGQEVQEVPRGLSGPRPLSRSAAQPPAGPAVSGGHDAVAGERAGQRAFGGGLGECDADHEILQERSGFVHTPWASDGINSNNRFVMS